MRRINEFCADRGRLIHFVGADPALGRPGVNVLEVKLEVGVILGPDPEHLTVGQIRPDGVCFVSLFPIRGPVGWGPRKGNRDSGSA